MTKKTVGDDFALISKVFDPSKLRVDLPAVPDFKCRVPDGETIFIALANVKGGVGKSTLAYTLAGFLSLHHRVKLLDFDGDTLQPDANLGASGVVVPKAMSSQKQASSYVMSKIAERNGYKLGFNVDTCSNREDLIHSTLVKAGADNYEIVIFDLGGDTRLPDSTAKAIDLTIIPTTTSPLDVMSLTQTVIAPLPADAPESVMPRDIENLPGNFDLARAEFSVSNATERVIFTTGHKPLFVLNMYANDQISECKQQEGMLISTLARHGISDLTRIPDAAIFKALPPTGLSLFSPEAAENQRLNWQLRLASRRSQCYHFLHAVHKRLLASGAMRHL